MQVPVTILNANTKREQGRKAQLGNIAAAKAVADIIRTTLGPRSMLKMLLDPNGSEYTQLAFQMEGGCCKRRTGAGQVGRRCGMRARSVRWPTCPTQKNQTLKKLNSTRHPPQHHPNPTNPCI